MKIALSHDWLNGMRGGEKCLEEFCKFYPDSDIFTLFYDESKVSEPIRRHTIHTSHIQSFPFVLDRYRTFLPFFPKAIESFDLSRYDLVISTSHCVAKGIRKPEHALHICYCFTPVRYAWELFDEYFGQKNFVEKAAIKYFMERLKKWDAGRNAGVDKFIAISEHVKKRIQKYYGRDSEVIYPPVDTDFYYPDETKKRQAFYLIVSALVPYKKIEIAIEAFNHSGKRLEIVGDGPLRKKLEALAKPTINFRGWQTDEAIRNYYQTAKALIFPGEEDFGIVPVEMQACGGAVIAYQKGGALETIIPDKTGVFFEAQTAEALEKAVQKFENGTFSPLHCRENSLKFNTARFKQEIQASIDLFVKERRKTQ